VGHQRAPARSPARARPGPLRGRDPADVVQLRVRLDGGAVLPGNAQGRGHSAAPGGSGRRLAHTALAGLDTRLEAFVESIAGRA
jgi:hypothetical protein